MKSGWELKPLGWVALIFLVGSVVYFLFFHDQQKKQSKVQEREPNILCG
jgi:preprotein translocase subunit YajC